MSRLDPAAEELQAQRSALRRQQFQERLRAERAASSSPLQRARERNEARQNELRESELRTAGAVQIRENLRSTSEADTAALTRSAEQAKEEQRATRQARVTDRIRQEEELERQAELRSGGIREKRRGSEDDEAEARAQRERDLEAAIQQRREQNRQARGREEEPQRRQTKVSEDESAQQSRARRGAADVAPGGQPVQAVRGADRESRAAIIARQQQEQAAAEALQSRSRKRREQRSEGSFGQLSRRMQRPKSRARRNVLRFRRRCRLSGRAFGMRRRSRG